MLPQGCQGHLSALDNARSLQRLLMDLARRLRILPSQVAGLTVLDPSCRTNSLLVKRRRLTTLPRPLSLLPLATVYTGLSYERTSVLRVMASERLDAKQTSRQVFSQEQEHQDAFDTALRMLKPDSMRAASSFMLDPSAAEDISILSDADSVANTNFVSGERHFVGAPSDSGVHISAIRVPSFNLGPAFEFTVGIFATRVAAAPCRRQFSPPPGILAQQSSTAPTVNVRARVFSSGRYTCNVQTGEAVNVLADLRLNGDKVETISILWRGPPHSGDSRVRGHIDLLCDAKQFAAGRRAASILSCERTVHVSFRAAYSLPTPASKRDLQVSCRNMTFFDSGTSVAFHLQRRADEPARLDVSTAVAKSDDSFLARGGTSEELTALSTIPGTLDSKKQHARDSSPDGIDSRRDDAEMSEKADRASGPRTSSYSESHVVALERACVALASLCPRAGVKHERALLRRASARLEVEVAAAEAPAALAAAAGDSEKSVDESAGSTH